MKKTATVLFAVVMLVSCQQKTHETACSSCAEALIAYSEQYPAAEPTDLYKMVFQDLYGPGHLLTDSTAALRYITAEFETMDSPSGMPPYEYTLCDSNFVRVNLSLVQHGAITAEQLADAMVRTLSVFKTEGDGVLKTFNYEFAELPEEDV